MSTDLWRGNFGNTYHKRNRFSPEDVKPVFDRILGGYDLDTVLEVGSGLGHNLAAITAKRKTGVEPNDSARVEAQEHYLNIEFTDGDATNLPYLDSCFDLVLTCGLLIHIPPDNIQQAIEEIARVSAKYVLAIEYKSVEEEEVPYRGLRDVLWRRPYGKLFVCWAGMREIARDDADSNLYPGCSWWLLAKN